MSIHWQSFILGAPIWGSLGIAVFAALLAAGRRVSGKAVPEDDAGGVPSPDGGDVEAPPQMLSLEKLRRRRAYPPGWPLERGRPAMPGATAERALPH